MEEQQTALQLRETKELAQIFYESGLFRDTASHAQAIVKVMAGREMGMEPFYSMQNIAIIRGRIYVGAHAHGAQLKRTGRYDYRIKRIDEERAEIDFYQLNRAKNELDHVHTAVYTIEDAKKAGLIRDDSGWVKNPQDMLFARCLARGARRVAPEMFAGVYVKEEAEEVESQLGSVADIPEDVTEAKPETPPEKPKPTEQEKQAGEDWQALEKSEQTEESKQPQSGPDILPERTEPYNEEPESASAEAKQRVAQLAAQGQQRAIYELAQGLGWTVRSAKSLSELQAAAILHVIDRTGRAEEVLDQQAKLKAQAKPKRKSKQEPSEAPTD